jgi:cation:H+ antiporter
MLLWLQAPDWTHDYATLAVLAGLILLVAGAELLVRAAIWIALVVGMSRMAVGLTLVAIGTSLPELLVSVTATRSGRPTMAMANVLGSNAANVLLIIGTAAAIRAIHLRTRWLELGHMLVMTALLCVPFVAGARLDRWLSAIMLAALAVFCWHLLAHERAARRLAPAEQRPSATLPGWLGNLALLAGGFLMLIYGADWLVEGASSIAMSFGMTEAVVGMTIVAIGTSLPELATSAVAAIRGQPEICVGNVIGSNIFNVGAVLGVTGLVQPLPVDSSALLSLLLVTIAASIVLTFLLRKRKSVTRGVGVLFLLSYSAFLTYKVVVHPEQ